MTLLELKTIAESRGQFLATAMVMGRPSGLMYDGPVCTLDKLAESLNTDAWELWCDDTLIAQDDDGVGISRDIPIDWSEFGIINFIRRPVSRLEAT